MSLRSQAGRRTFCRGRVSAQAARICHLVSEHSGSAADCAEWLADGYTLEEVQQNLIALRRAQRAPCADPAARSEPRPAAAAAATKPGATKPVAISWGDVQKANAERLAADRSPAR